MVEKYYNEKGEVAVLYSPEFGAGWYTWNTEFENSEGLLFDKTLVEMVLKRTPKDEVKEYVNEKWGDVYMGGYDDIEVKFLPEGTAFQVTEYDGCESIVIEEDMGIHVA